MINKILIIFLLSTISLIARDVFTISGKVLETQNKNPLVGARIFIENSLFGAITKKDGSYIISNVSSGKNRISVRYIGYETKTIEINLRNDLTLDFIIDQEIFKTNEIVVSANKNVQNVQDVPISVSTIDSKSLIDMGITEIDEALKYVPGVEVNKDNVSIRGSSGFSFGVGSRVSLLLDGFQLISGDNGDMKFDALPIFVTDRIEVVKGAGSALYGSSALGGVVNLITQESTEKMQFKAQLSSGIYTQPRFEQWKYTEDIKLNSGFIASFNKLYDKIGIIAYGGINRNDGYRLYDKSDRWNLFTKINFDLSDKLKLNVYINNAFEDRTDWVYWNSLDSATRPPTSTNLNINLKSGKYNVFSDLKMIIDDSNFGSLKTGVYYTSLYNTYSENNPEYRQSDAIQFIADAQMNSRIFSDLMLTYGLNFNNANVASKTFNNQNQQVYSAYVQGEYQGFDNLIITLGSRIDKENIPNINTEVDISPKLGLNYQLYSDFHLRASIGKGFRSPSIAERFSSVAFQGFQVKPNIDLKSEKNLSYEIGFNYKMENDVIPLYLDFAAFRNDMKDLIEPTFTKTGNTEIQFINITEARVQGIEFGLRTMLFKFIGLESSITYMDPMDLTLNSFLKYRSKYLWYSRLLLPLGEFELQLDYRFKSNVENIDEQLGLAIKDIDAKVETHVVDARFIWKFNAFGFEKNQLTLNIKNLFDYYYLDVVGNLAMTRLISLQYNITF